MFNTMWVHLSKKNKTNSYCFEIKIINKTDEAIRLAVPTIRDVT